MSGPEECDITAEQAKEKMLEMMLTARQQLLLRKCMKNWERKNNNGTVDIWR